jgi:type IV fimbrial biogenesis protein FimT
MIELMIGLVLMAVLLMLITPTYAEFLRNAKIRNTADSIAGGIRLAQTEAIRRNQNVELVINVATGWQVRDPVTPAILHDEPFTDAAGQIVVDPNPAAAFKLTYSPIGQLLVPTNPDDGSNTLLSVAVRHATFASRDLRVITESFGQGVRVCDNDATVHASLRCPAGVP